MSNAPSSLLASPGAGHGVHDGRHRTILADRGIGFLEEAGNSNCGDREMETLPNH